MENRTPDFIFETSWEVCNKVGGIYAVLSTRARTLKERFGDNVVFVGPDIRGEGVSPDFAECPDHDEWARHFGECTGLGVRTGRWQVCGRPVAILVDFAPLYDRKNDIYADMWNRYGVDSLHAYGDYDEASMFGYAAGMVISSFYGFYNMTGRNVCAHFNEWMSAFGLLYLRSERPAIATLFTTHATTVGRSIAGNGKPLYDYMPGYFGYQMAAELNVQSKHSVEKAAAHFADCFTTVSGITDRECAQLLERSADVVTPNGFEPDFVPKGAALTAAVKRARGVLGRVAGALCGTDMPGDTFYMAISGRYEYKNKGIDVYLDVLERLRGAGVERPVVAYVLVPAWSGKERGELNERLASGVRDGALAEPFVTHEMMEPDRDPVMNRIRSLAFTNMPDERVKVIFVPKYLDGRDGVFNMPYYDVLCGFDLTVFPSYYEPWGYTPMESVAFGVPTVTTDLSGYGLWCKGGACHVRDGVGVVHRTDSNYHDVVEAIAEDVTGLMSAMKDDGFRKGLKAKLRRRAKSTTWSEFIAYYYRAYDIALGKRDGRMEK